MQMGVGLAVLTETKLTDDRYTRLTLGFKGGLALLWKENHPGYEVELAGIIMPNLLTLKLLTGNKQVYCMGIYIPPPMQWGGSPGCLGSFPSRLHHPHCPGGPEYRFWRTPAQTGRIHCRSL